MTDVYVSSSIGNDTTGDGSTGTPYATLQKAIDTISSGTAGNPNSIYLAKEVFTDVASTNQPGDGTASYTSMYLARLSAKHDIYIGVWSGQGTEARPILRYPNTEYARYDSGDGLIITGNNSLSATYNIVVDGIEVDGDFSYADASRVRGDVVGGSGIVVQDGAYDCDVKNCVAHGFNLTGIHARSSSPGTTYGPDGILFENCVSYSNGLWSTFGGSGFSMVDAGRGTGGVGNSMGETDNNPNSSRNSMVLRNCYSYDNESGNNRDGSGLIFDFCGSFTQGWSYAGLLLMEGCVAYNNWGPGLNVTQGKGTDCHVVIRYNTSIQNCVTPYTFLSNSNYTDYLGYSEADTAQVYGNVFIAPPSAPSAYGTEETRTGSWQLAYLLEAIEGDVTETTTGSTHSNLLYNNGQTYTVDDRTGAEFDNTDGISFGTDPLLTDDAPDATARLDRAWAALTSSSPVIASQSPTNPDTTATSFNTTNGLTIDDPADDYAGTARLSPPSWGAIEEVTEPEPEPGPEYVPGQDVIVRRVVRTRGGVRLRPWSQSWQVQ